MELLGKVRPRTKGQEALLKALQDEDVDIVGVFGPSGTGKSLITIAYAIDALMKGKFKRFIIARPLIDIVSGKELTPADVGVEDYKKLASAYLEDILSEYVPKEEIERLQREGKLMLVDTHYLRGRTFDDSIVILDDAQNAFQELKNEMLYHGYEIEDADQTWIRLKNNNDFVVLELFVIDDNFENGCFLEIC